jgi:hypothetical protein
MDCQKEAKGALGLQSPEKSATSLGSLSGDFLSAITDYLGQHEIGKLFICGKKTLNATLCDRGGIKRVCFDHLFFTSFPRLVFSFKSLETITILAPLNFFLYSGAQDSTGALIPHIWPNLRRLTLRAERPFIPTRCVCNFQLSCPKLRYFAYTTEQWHEEDVVWPTTLETLYINRVPLQQAEMVLDLPPSLTSLHLEGVYRTKISFKQIPPGLCEVVLPGCWSNALWLQLIAHLLPNTDAMPHLLENLSRIHVGCSALKMNQFSSLLTMPSLTSLLLDQFDILPPYHISWPTKLIELTLNGSAVLPQNFTSLLPCSLTVLKLSCSLALLTRSSFEALPPNLTELRATRRSKETLNQFRVFWPVANRFPLTKLEWVGISAQLNDEVISHMPHTLLALGQPRQGDWAPVAHVVPTLGPYCTLPSSLTALYLPDFNQSFTAKMAARMPQHLLILHIRSPQFLRPDAIAALPRSLTELFVMDDAVINSAHIPLLPPSLKTFRTLFGKSTTPVSLQLLPKTLRTAIFPDLLKLGLDAVACLPSSITTVRIPGSLHNIPAQSVLQSLPESTIRLEMTLEDLSHDTCYALPKGLTHLRSASKIPTFDTNALRAALPQLTALDLPNHSAFQFRLGAELRHIRYLRWKASPPITHGEPMPD